jgi:hypothetical protein
MEKPQLKIISNQQVNNGVIMIMMKLPYIGKRLDDPIMDNLGNLCISQEKGGSARKRCSSL